MLISAWRNSDAVLGGAALALGQLKRWEAVNTSVLQTCLSNALKSGQTCSDSSPTDAFPAPGSHSHPGLETMDGAAVCQFKILSTQKALLIHHLVIQRE